MANFSTIIYPESSYKINGVLFSVHNELGRYCNEKQYADCVGGYLKKLELSYEREKNLSISFENEHGTRNRVDFIIENRILLELKAERIIQREDYYQARRYLSALNKKLGILVNLRDKYLKPKRIINPSVKE